MGRKGAGAGRAGRAGPDRIRLWGLAESHAAGTLRDRREWRYSLPCHQRRLTPALPELRDAEHNRVLSTAIALAASCAAAARGLRARSPPAADGRGCQAFVEEAEQRPGRAEPSNGRPRTGCRPPTSLATRSCCNARASERMLEYFSKAIKESRRFDGVQLDDATARTIKLLKLSDQVSAPAPDDATKRAELATIMARMEGHLWRGQVLRDEGRQGGVPQHRPALRHDREEPQLRRADRGLGRLAQRGPPDARGLRALRGTGQ